MRRAIYPHPPSWTLRGSYSKNLSSLSLHRQVFAQSPSSLRRERGLSSTAPARQDHAQQRAQNVELSESVRRLMRLVPHPVAIVTSTDNTSASIDKHVPHRWRGATVSSFNTVTLSPTPVVSFNIKRQSATFTAIDSSGLFNIHLLSHAIEAQAIAARFASGNALNPFHNKQQAIEEFVRQNENDSHDSLPPVIQTKDESLAREAITAFRLQCQYLQDKTVDIGDHVVVFGQVMETEKATESIPCLVYVDQRYGKIS